MYNNKDYKDYFATNAIIKILCTYRIKYSSKRNKKVLLDRLGCKKGNSDQFVDPYDIEILRQLSSILPARRLWCKNGQTSYKLIKGNETLTPQLKKLDTDEKNRIILFNTVTRYLKVKNPPPFIINLLTFVNEIQTSVQNGTYNFCPPEIIPEIKQKNESKHGFELKQNGVLECRPISRFILKDKIVSSLSNKFFTEIFDEFFEESSFAFRASNSNPYNKKNHHSAVEQICEYRKIHKDGDLYVAECDLKKFYDTVNHKKCLELFYQLMQKRSSLSPSLDLYPALNIFHGYLKCYTFKDNVITLNGDDNYWKNQKNYKNEQINGFYPWVEKDIFKSSYYRQFQNDRIGVPQGGALSGLIANILLDYSDKKMKNIEGLLYIRYCDDMILMHSDERICNMSIHEFKESVHDLYLFNHPLKKDFFVINKNWKNNKTDHKRVFSTDNVKIFNRSFKDSIKPFWDSKSKGPYKWAAIDKDHNALPWIAFVGYEINYKGEIRIRKKSLHKEVEKQKRVIQSIVRKVSENRRASVHTIYKSAKQRLIGMSVGRITLYNYTTYETKICWASGFRALNLNKSSKQQLRSLDRNKSRSLNILRRFLALKPTKYVKGTLQENKPFSYYYQAGEKREINRGLNL